MFYTPKPRQFHYTPRLYDPEKEEWEKLKTKYRLEQGLPLSDDALRAAAAHDDADASADDDLAYFQNKVRDLDRRERQESHKLTLSDMFRKREMPQFHYVSRFDAEGNLLETPPSATKNSVPARRIRRRFDEDDMDRFKPVPAGKIMIYTLLVCVLLFFIFS